MIYPDAITNFNRTTTELEEFFMFSIVVAGKTAIIQAKKLDEFLYPAWLEGISPFEYVDKLCKNKSLNTMLKYHRLGQYSRISYVLHNCRNLDLKNCSVEDLERIKGIGPKTSRFFILHSRPNQNYAVLDTHILKWMRDNLELKNVPAATPQSKKRYGELEKIFLDECEKRQTTPEKLDLEIWNEHSNGIKSAA